MGWVVSARPRPLYPRENIRYQLYIRLREPQGSSGCRGKTRPHRVRAPNRPARSKSLFRPTPNTTRANKSEVWRARHVARLRTWKIMQTFGRRATSWRLAITWQDNIKNWSYSNKMLGHGVDLSGLGQRPVTNMADRFACSTRGGGRGELFASRRHQFPDTVRIWIQLSRCDTFRWWKLLDRWVGHGARKWERQSQTWQENAYLVYILIRLSQNNRSREKNKYLSLRFQPWLCITITLQTYGSIIHWVTGWSSSTPLEKPGSPSWNSTHFLRLREPLLCAHSPLLPPLPSQIVYALSFYFFNIHFNIILPSTPRSSKCFFFTKTPYEFPFSPHAYYMPCSTHLPLKSGNSTAQMDTAMNTTYVPRRYSSTVVLTGIRVFDLGTNASPIIILQFGCPSEAAHSLNQAHVSEQSLGLIHVKFQSVRYFNVFTWRTLRIHKCHYLEAKEAHVWTTGIITSDCGHFCSPPHGATAPSGPGPLIIDSWLSHSDTPHSVGLLWTSDQPDTETSTWQHTTLTTDINVSGGIQTRKPNKRADIHSRLRRAATWIGFSV